MLRHDTSPKQYRVCRTRKQRKESDSRREINGGQFRLSPHYPPDPIRGTGNKYVYANNNPLSNVDPYGLVTLVQTMDPEFATWFKAEENRPDPLIVAEQGDPVSMQVGTLNVAEDQYLHNLEVAAESGNEAVENPPRLQRAQAQASQEQGQPAQEAQNTSYTATILGQKVPVSITGGTADDRGAIQGRLNGAIGDINQHAGDLSASDTKTIHNIKSITVDDSQRTGVDVKTGTYNLKSSYVMNEGSTAAWLASTIGHDAYHVTQFQQGEIYNKQTAPRLEREANQFQIRVGATFGLTQSQIDYIRNDTHTLYNTPPY